MIHDLCITNCLIERWSYLEKFIVRWFKIFWNKIQFIQDNIAAIYKNLLLLVLLYLGAISFQTISKLIKSIKEVCTCCKLQIVFKSHNNFWNIFRFTYLFYKFFFFMFEVPYIFLHSQLYIYSIYSIKQFFI